MKKLSIFTILILLLALVGCEKNNENKRTLTPVADCKVGSLEDGKWVCVWADEFDGDEVDEDKWNFEINDYGGGNNELQYYIKDNATVSDGILTITGKREAYKTRAYTSSRLTSKFKGDFTYGRFQIRAKNPLGKGSWPAVWMMPTRSYYGTWPNSGEIDIMEYVGYDQTRIHHTVHTRSFNHNIGTQKGKSFQIDSTTDFVLYELLWEPGKLTWFVDGYQVFSFSYNARLHQDKPYDHVFPFDKPFFLILNLAIGGSWGGAQGIDLNAFPMYFEIDYVRVYQLDYKYLDKKAPQKVENVTKATLKNTLFWDKGKDDVGIEYYNIYVNGQLHQDTNLNQVTIKSLAKGTYNIEIAAVDFTGKVGPRSDVFEYVHE